MTTPSTIQPIRVFMIGNNPIDLSDVYQKLKEFTSESFQTEYSFDLKKSYDYILKNKPSCVLIDDNIGHPYMRKLIARLAGHRETQYIPVAILKNSNYTETGAVSASDFILKEGLSADGLRKSIMRTIGLRPVKHAVVKEYRKGRMMIRRLLGNNL